MRNIFVIIYFVLTAGVALQTHTVNAQTVETSPAVQNQPSEMPLPEIPPTPRSKLEIIQYSLLPFAIGAAIWLILRLERMEREEKRED